jgi:hypothetical protein
VSETNWMLPQRKNKMRIYLTQPVGMWIEYDVDSTADFHNMVNCIRSQGMLLTKTSYIKEQQIAWIVLMTPDGKPLGNEQPGQITPAPTAPSTETPQ